MYNIINHGPECLIVDDFLSYSDWEKIYNQVQVDQWSKVDKSSDKYWHLTDGDVYKTKRILPKQRPCKNSYDIWFHRLDKFLNTDAAKNFVGEHVGYSLRAYAYPVGSKNPWHDDMGTLTYAYYLHRRWQINWDGSLLVIPKGEVVYNQTMKLNDETTALDSYSKQNTPMAMFEQDKKYEEIIEYGRGFFVSPKPNRLVIINKNIVHGINRVDADAGDNIRLSLGGAIMPKEYDGPIMIPKYLFL